MAILTRNLCVSYRESLIVDIGCNIFDIVCDNTNLKGLGIGCWKKKKKIGMIMEVMIIMIRINYFDTVCFEENSRVELFFKYNILHKTKRKILTPRLNSYFSILHIYSTIHILQDLVYTVYLFLKLYLYQNIKISTYQCNKSRKILTSEKQLPY